MKFRFTGVELCHILASILVLVVAVSGVGFFYLPSLPAILGRVSVVSLPLAMGFVSHELAHKWVAMRYGHLAIYRMWTLGLVLALLVGLATNGRIIFAAPGAVVILAPYFSRREGGMISLSGPLTNILLAALFLGVSFIDGVVGIIGMQGVFINLWLAFFNMLPLPPLDGSKVFFWNPIIWATLEIPLAAVIFLVL